jgi:hypothetical protein
MFAAPAQPGQAYVAFGFSSKRGVIVWQPRGLDYDESRLRALQVIAEVGSSRGSFTPPEDLPATCNSRRGQLSGGIDARMIPLGEWVWRARRRGPRYRDAPLGARRERLRDIEQPRSQRLTLPALEVDAFEGAPLVGTLLRSAYSNSNSAPQAEHGVSRRCECSSQADRTTIGSCADMRVGSRST